MPNFLWAFTSDNSTSAGGSSISSNAVTPLPKLSPSGSQPNNVSNAGSTKGNQLVNVVRDFYWTYTKPGDVSRAETPRIILTERKLKTNALIAQIKYSLTNTLNPAKSIISDASKLFSPITSVLGKAIDSATPSAGLAATGLDQTLGAAGQAIGGAIATAAGAAYNLANSVANNSIFGDNNPTTAGPYLQPYRNLYLTEPTNWVYILPYFSDNQAAQGNSFSESGSPLKGPLGVAANAAVTAVTDIAEAASSLASPTQITYVEKTKFFQYDTDGGETMDIEFPLINTGSVSYDDVVRNWQFLFLLIYQNRPGKTGFNTVDQPVIYEAEIPGTKFFPYCYISSITVDFVGARREMPINIPVSSSTINSAQTSQGATNGVRTINTIIPDAYRVKISLKSLTANTRNFMAHMITQQSIIETGTK